MISNRAVASTRRRSVPTAPVVASPPGRRHHEHVFTSRGPAIETRADRLDSWKGSPLFSTAPFAPCNAGSSRKAYPSTAIFTREANRSTPTNKRWPPGNCFVRLASLPRRLFQPHPRIGSANFAIFASTRGRLINGCYGNRASALRSWRTVSLGFASEYRTSVLVRHLRTT